jgi:Fic family protein
VYMLKAVEETKGKMQKKAPNIYTYELLEVLFTQVYSKYAFLEEKGIASRNTASKYFNKLVEIGIVDKEKVGNEFIFKNKELYNLFTNH